MSMFWNTSDCRVSAVACQWGRFWALGVFIGHFFDRLNSVGKENVVFAGLMDAGKLLKARVTDNEMKGVIHIILIRIDLVTFE